ncbi:protoheme IX farnesyltransferase [Chloroflexota bacterium]
MGGCLIYRAVRNYLEVLKPRESGLLTFIGVASAIVAAGGQPPGQLVLALFAILVASAGANGLTNYLDRGVDARMQRTRNRALPSKRIHPPQKVLPLTLGLVVIGLVLAGLLHWSVLVADLVGTTAAVVWRKRITCVFPQGAVASCTPVLMGWLAVKPVLDWEILLLCLLIAVWLPLHVWSIMIVNRDDYLNAGLSYFPLNIAVRKAVWVLFGFSLVLYAASIVLYFVGGFGWLYLAAANILGVIIVYGSTRMAVSSAPRDTWRLYKLSAFPYLGVIFLVMCMDIWLVSG